MPPTSPRSSGLEVPADGAHQTLEDLRAASSTRRLAETVEAIRDAYLDVAQGSARRLADELTAIAARLREPPEGVDPASLVLETNRLLGEVERSLARRRP